MEVFAEFKKLADLKRTVYDADIRALIDGTLQDTPHVWSIIGFQTIAGKGIQHVAEVRLEHRDGEERQEAACGDGPVDSLFKAMDRATGMRVELHDYNVRSVTQGKDAQGEVTVETVRNRRRYRGRAVSTDVIEASADAYMSLVNQVLADEMPTLAAPPTKKAAQPLRAHEQADAR